MRTMAVEVTEVARKTSAVLQSLTSRYRWLRTRRGCWRSRFVRSDPAATVLALLGSPYIRVKPIGVGAGSATGYRRPERRR